MKILFIGNSYTFYNDMPNIFQSLAKENGINCEVYSVTKGGRKLYSNLNENDEYGEKIKEIVKDGKIDCLILQEQSFFPLIDEEKFNEGISGLINLIHPERTILYSTWGRKAGSSLLSEHGWTNESMAIGLHAAYKKVAVKNECEISEVGLCFLKIGNEHPECELYADDLSHPSYLGSAVAAIAIYKRVFGKMPEVLTSIKADVQDYILTTIKKYGRIRETLEILLSFGASRAEKIVKEYNAPFGGKEEFLAFQDSLSVSGDRIIYDENEAKITI